jgi:hypothetical protein
MPTARMQVPTVPKHPNALRALTQASIALKHYCAHGTIPEHLNLGHLIELLDEAHRDINDCQKRIRFH